MCINLYVLKRVLRHFNSEQTRGMLSQLFGSVKLSLNYRFAQNLLPVPFRRFHEFDSQFEPLQFALNGRKGRRIGCVLGNLGMVMEVLDMDDEEVDDELDHQENDEQNESRDTSDIMEPEMHQVQEDGIGHTFGNGVPEYEGDGVDF